MAETRLSRNWGYVAYLNVFLTAIILVLTFTSACVALSNGQQGPFALINSIISSLSYLAVILVCYALYQWLIKINSRVAKFSFILVVLGNLGLISILVSKYLEIIDRNFASLLIQVFYLVVGVGLILFGQMAKNDKDLSAKQTSRKNIGRLKLRPAQASKWIFWSGWALIAFAFSEILFIWSVGLGLAAAWQRAIAGTVGSALQLSGDIYIVALIFWNVRFGQIIFKKRR